MKRIFKYGTGEEVPKGAIYMGTVTQTQIQDSETKEWINCYLVWHYFQVEVKE
jgi:hypothetical protein